MVNIKYKNHRKSNQFAYWHRKDYDYHTSQKRFNNIAAYSDDPDVRAELIRNEIRKMEDTIIYD